MKLYNSLTHQKEDFIPNEPGKVQIYTCGPTVYHFAHIGNLRTYIMEDALVRSLSNVAYQAVLGATGDASQAEAARVRFLDDPYNWNM